MKTEITAFELRYLAQELQQLVGSRVDKIYQPDGFLMQLHRAGLGKILVRIEKSALWITAKKPEVPDKITGLCGLLRKYLEGKKLEAIEQIESERIVKLTFATQKETYHLYIELFSNGNIILTDNEGIVKAAQEERAWKDREIKRGLPYKLPPSRKNIFALTPPDFEPTEAISKHLAKLGLGKVYATEICTRAVIDPTATELTKKQQEKLFAAYQTLLADKTRPTAHPDGEITPITLQQYDEGKSYPTFSAALDENLAQSAELQKLDRKKQKYLAEKERIENAIKLQRKGLERIEREATEHQKAGELIYEHYQELRELLDELNKAKKKHSLHEIKEKLKDHPKIKNVEPKTADVTIEVSHPG